MSHVPDGFSVKGKTREPSLAENLRWLEEFKKRKKAEEKAVTRIMGKHLNRFTW